MTVQGVAEVVIVAARTMSMAKADTEVRAHAIGAKAEVTVQAATRTLAVQGVAEIVIVGTVSTSNADTEVQAHAIGAEAEVPVQAATKTLTVQGVTKIVIVAARTVSMARENTEIRAQAIRAEAQVTAQASVTENVMVAAGTSIAGHKDVHKEVHEGSIGAEEKDDRRCQAGFM